MTKPRWQGFARGLLCRSKYGATERDRCPIWERFVEFQEDAYRRRWGVNASASETRGRAAVFGSWGRARGFRFRG